MEWCVWRLVLVIGWLVSLVSVPWAIALLRGAVKYAVRIGEVHDPWGMPVFMGASPFSHLDLLTLSCLRGMSRSTVPM